MHLFIQISLKDQLHLATLDRGAVIEVILKVKRVAEESSTEFVSLGARNL
jgi:hypothetical protein